MNLKKNIIKTMYGVARSKMLKIVTGNLGDIIEENDKIICIVSQKKLNKMYKKDRSLILRLDGVSPDSKEYINYKIDKPIYYIFEYITFSNRLQFSSTFKPHVIFKGCTFNQNINIIWASGEVRFEHNYYNNEIDYGYIYSEKEMLFGKRINKIVFDGEHFENGQLEFPTVSGHFGMNIDANEVQIINTGIKIQNPGICFIKTGNLKLDHAFIKCDELYIDSFKIESTDSPIVCKNVCIDNSNNDKIKLIYANTLIYNNIQLKDDDLLDKDEKVVFDEVVVNIDKERITKQKLKLELVEMLKDLKNKCEEIKQEELEQKEQELNNKEVSKILRK